MKTNSKKTESFLNKLYLISFLKTQYELNVFEIAFILDSEPEIIEIYEKLLIPNLENNYETTNIGNKEGII